MPTNISTAIREVVEQRAKNLCEYCHLPKTEAHFRHQVDHIIPRKHGGETTLENLALACWRCNIHKGTDVAAYDLKTGDLTPLFNPRTQIWTEHFQVNDDGIIESLTATARVTIRILRFNDEERVEERRGLIAAELY